MRCNNCLLAAIIRREWNWARKVHLKWGMPPNHIVRDDGRRGGEGCMYSHCMHCIVFGAPFALNADNFNCCVQLVNGNANIRCSQKGAAWLWRGREATTASCLSC